MCPVPRTPFLTVHLDLWAGTPQNRSSGARVLWDSPGPMGSLIQPLPITFPCRKQPRPPADPVSRAPRPQPPAPGAHLSLGFQPHSHTLPRVPTRIRPLPLHRGCSAHSVTAPLAACPGLITFVDCVVRVGGSDRHTDYILEHTDKEWARHQAHSTGSREPRVRGQDAPWWPIQCKGTPPVPQGTHLHTDCPTQDTAVSPTPGQPSCAQPGPA